MSIITFDFRTILASPTSRSSRRILRDFLRIRRTYINPNLNGQFRSLIARESYVHGAVEPLCCTAAYHGNDRNNSDSLLSTYPGLGIKSWHRSTFAAVISGSCNLDLMNNALWRTHGNHEPRSSLDNSSFHVFLFFFFLFVNQSSSPPPPSSLQLS